MDDTKRDLVEHVNRMLITEYCYAKRRRSEGTNRNRVPWSNCRSEFPAQTAGKQIAATIAAQRSSVSELPLHSVCRFRDTRFSTEDLKLTARLVTIIQDQPNSDRSNSIALDTNKISV